MGLHYDSGREPIIVNFHMHVCDMLADQKCQSHIHDTGLVNPAHLQMLRIDREGMIDDVVMHGTRRHSYKKCAKKMLLEL